MTLFLIIVAAILVAQLVSGLVCYALWRYLTRAPKEPAPQATYREAE